jgi:hypothetical protein
MNDSVKSCSKNSPLINVLKCDEPVGGDAFAHFNADFCFRSSRSSSWIPDEAALRIMYNSIRTFQRESDQLSQYRDIAFYSRAKKFWMAISVVYGSESSPRKRKFGRFLRDSLLCINFWESARNINLSIVYCSEICSKKTKKKFFDTTHRIYIVSKNLI